MSGPIDWLATSFWGLLIGGILLVVAVRVVNAIRSSEKSHARQQDAETERLRDAGALLPDGALKCIVCERAPATRKWLATRKSQLDSDWLGHRKLHHHLPMYVVDESPDPTPQACESCRRMVEGKLEEVLSGGRDAAAKLRNDHERDLAHWENGGLLHWAQTEASKSYRSRYPVAQSQPTLLALPAETTPVHHSGSVTLPPASSDEGEGEA